MASSGASNKASNSVAARQGAKEAQLLGSLLDEEEGGSSAPNTSNNSIPRPAAAGRATSAPPHLGLSEDVSIIFGNRRGK